MPGQSHGPLPARRSIRLQGYDYSAPHVYFVTICTHLRRQLLADIEDGGVDLTGLGRLVTKEWVRTEAIRPQVKLDRFVVMPNHMHALIAITDRSRTEVEDLANDGLFWDEALHDAHAFTQQGRTVGAIVRGFKGATTGTVRRLKHDPSFCLWQRGMYEHVVRDYEDLERIREYIADNNRLWAEDPENPGRRPKRSAGDKPRAHGDV